MIEKSPVCTDFSRFRLGIYSLDHLKMLQCLHNRILFFLRTLGLLRIFIFRFMVIFSFDDAALLFHLCDIEIGYLQLMVFPHIIPNFVVSRLALRSSHIQLLHVDVHFDVPLDIEFGQKKNRFTMLRPWKQIHRLDLLGVVALCFQPFGVSCSGGGVAADVDDPAGGHGDDGRKGGLVTAFAGRVEDDDVGVEALGGELRCGFARVGAEEAASGGDGFAHAGRVGLGAVDGFGDDLHADERAAAVHHRKADGAHAAVEVQQKIIRLELNVFGGDAVKPLGGEGVDLIERQGAKPHRNAAEGVLDEAGAAEGVGLCAHNDVGVPGVDVHEDGGNVRELCGQLLDEFGAVGELCAGADDADHDLAAVRTPAQEDVPHQALAGSLIVGLDAVCTEKAAQCVADVVQDAGLQLAVGAGDDAVGATGVEADAGHTVLVTPDRELDLVAVAVHFGGGESVQHRHVQPADAAERIGDVFLLGPQFGGVIQVPQAAAAAGACHGAVYRDAVR